MPATASETVRQRATELVLQNEQRSPIGVALTMLLFGIGVNQWVPMASYLPFALLIVSLNTASAVSAALILKSMVHHRERRFLTRFQIASSALGGCAWGLGPLLLHMPDDPTPHAIIVIFQGALLTITTTSMGADRRRYLAFSAPMVVFGVVTNLVEHQRLQLTVALGMTVFGILLYNLNKEVHKTFLNNVTLTIRNERLVEELSEANAALEIDNDKLQLMALTDQLTGVANRNGWDLALRASMQEPSTTDLAVVIADVDNFKQVNDTLGHEAGDLVLESIARRLSSAVKATDTVARLGGDEFGILLHHVASDADLDKIRDRIIASLSHDFTYDGFVQTVTMSLGAARYRTGLSISDLLREADRDLYAMKRQRQVVEVEPGDTGGVTARNTN